MQLGRLRVGAFGKRWLLVWTAVKVTCCVCMCVCCVCCPRPCGCPRPCPLHCSVNDWTLGLLYRVHSSSSIWLQAAGMYKVEVPGWVAVGQAVRWQALAAGVDCQGDLLCVYCCVCCVCCTRPCRLHCSVENINLSRLVAVHGDYLTSMEDVLEAINMHDT